MKLIDRMTRGTAAILILLTAAVSAFAQSTNQDYPTPVTTNEITGTIKARDIGDARLTSYYYQFDGSQGDLFLNLVTSNFTGDIDLFIMKGLRPLTKIVVYSEVAEHETGRVIYLRKPEKMILRIQGRPPGDDPASFRIKFAGSFVASTMTSPEPEPELPTVTARNESGIRVNSVGTIVEVIPKATPTPIATETRAATEDERAEAPAEEKKADKVATSDTPAETTEPEKKLEVVVTESVPPATTTATTTRRPARGRRRTPPKTTPPTETKVEPIADVPLESPGEPPTKATTTRRRRGATTTPPTTEAKTPDPLANVNLMIRFKDGTVIQRPLNEVLRFTVDKGLLTVIAKDGSIGRYSMIDVLRVTIE